MEYTLKEYILWVCKFISKEILKLLKFNPITKLYRLPDHIWWKITHKEIYIICSEYKQWMSGEIFFL